MVRLCRLTTLCCNVLSETLAMDRAELPPEQFAKRHESYTTLKAQEDLVLKMVVSRHLPRWLPASHLQVG